MLFFLEAVFGCLIDFFGFAASVVFVDVRLPLKAVFFGEERLSMKFEAIRMKKMKMAKAILNLRGN